MNILVYDIVYLHLVECLDLLSKMSESENLPRKGITWSERVYKLISRAVHQLLGVLTVKTRFAFKLFEIIASYSITSELDLCMVYLFWMRIFV